MSDTGTSSDVTYTTTETTTSETTSGTTEGTTTESSYATTSGSTGGTTTESSYGTTSGSTGGTTTESSYGTTSGTTEGTSTGSSYVTTSGTTEGSTTESTYETTSNSVGSKTQDTTSDSASMKSYDTTSESATSKTDPTGATNRHPEYKKRKFLLPEDILKFHGRQLRAEDSDWALCPVAELIEIIIKAAKYVKGPELKSLLINAEEDQRKRILETIPLDIPFKYVLPIEGIGLYWERQCLERWDTCDVWRYNNNWKAMLIERLIQDSIQTFKPGESDMAELKELLESLKDYNFRLEIKKLKRRDCKPFQANPAYDNFDEVLDDYIKTPESTAVFLDFESVLGTLTYVKDFSFVLSPDSLDIETFELSIKDFNCLFRGLRKLQGLLSFTCSNGFVTSNQMEVIIKLYCHHQCLRKMNLSYNLLDDDSCEYIGKLLLSPCPLEILILKYNRITGGGVEVIAAALTCNEKLRKLDLSLNWIGNRGGALLAKALLSNKTLEDLDLSRNKFGFGAGQAFANLIKTSKSMRNLKLAENNMGEECGRKFHDAVAENRTILNLDINFCSFKTDDEDGIHRALVRNRFLLPYETYVADRKNPAASEFTV